MADDAQMDGYWMDKWMLVRMVVASWWVDVGWVNGCWLEWWLHHDGWMDVGWVNGCWLEGWLHYGGWVGGWMREQLQQRDHSHNSF